MNLVRPAALARIDLFAELSAQELEELAACLKHQRCRPGAAIFVTGDPGTGLYVVDEGRVKIVVTSTDGREFILTQLGPGEYFGDLALLDEEPRSADAIAVEESHLLFLPREDFLRFMEARPAVAIKLVTVLARRLRRNTQQVQDTAYLDVPARLASVLLRVSAVDNSNMLSAKISTAELAGMVGASAESTAHWVGYFERQGVIRRTDGVVSVLKPDELRRRVP